MNTHETTNDHITAAEAARRIPSPKVGKRTHTSTVIRWIQKGILAGFRRGRYYFVKAASLAELLEPVQPERPREKKPRHNPTERERWVQAEKKRLKID